MEVSLYGVPGDLKHTCNGSLDVFLLMETKNLFDLTHRFCFSYHSIDLWFKLLINQQKSQPKNTETNFGGQYMPEWQILTLGSTYSGIWGQRHPEWGAICSGISSSGWSSSSVSPALRTNNLLTPPPHCNIR